MSKILDIALVILAVFPLSCNQGKVRGRIVVFHAGSLSLPMKELAREYEKENPGIRVLLEASGSREAARKVVDLGRSCDVLALADKNVVETLLMPELARFNILFAANSMVIAYTRESKYAKEIDQGNWFDVLSGKGVAVGRSDPEKDPCGYRALFVLELAELYYHNKHIKERVLANSGWRFIRPKETDLVALLEAGELDYVFIYKSVALQHGLLFLDLPGELNLGEMALARFYGKAEVLLSGRRRGERIRVRGAPILYSVTIPETSSNKRLGESFILFLLCVKGGRILKSMGQTPLRPPTAQGWENLPPALKRICRRKKE